MRIALVTHYMPPHTGGIEQVAALLARVYSDAGHDVTWVAAATPEAPGESSDGRQRLVRLAASNLLERRFGMPFPVPGPSGYARIAEAVRGSDVVHLQDCLYPAVLAADRAARRHDRPTLVTQHVGMVSFGGGVVDPLLFAAYRTAGRAVLRRARAVAFVSEGVRDWFLRRVDAELRATVVPNAVDTDRFAPASAGERRRARERLGVAAEGAVVLFAGRLVPKKNPRALVDALSRGSSRLLVVGDGPERGALAPLGARATHIVRLEHERMPEAYAAADLFVLPSTGEGLPLSLIEALASGLRCVVSDDPAFEPLAGCPAVTRAPLSRLPGAIAAALAAPDADRQAGADAARTWAVERYGVAAFSRRYLDLVREVAG